MSERDLLTVTEAAAMLGLKHAAVTRRLRLGQLAGVRVHDRLWLVPRAEVERAARVGRFAPGPRPAPARPRARKDG